MKTCSRCGGPINGTEMRGVCPKCLFEFAVEPAKDAPPVSSGADREDLPGLRLLKQIGQGGMGRVYKATQLGTGRTVAVKILADELSGDSKFVERFMSEARAMGKLNHANIVSAFDAASVKGRHYLIMEFVDGPTTEALLKARGPLAEKVCLQIGRQASLALGHAARHRIVHRDIKPGNIMISREGTIKVCDLGVAKRHDSSGDLGLTTIGTSVGTPLYMSPEQIQGKDVDARSDMYSLGATLFHLATGQPPFPGKTIRTVLTQHLSAPLPDPKKLNPRLSDAFCAVITRMLAKDSGNRYPSHEHAAQEFERVQQGKAVIARVPTKRVVSRAAPPPPRSKAPLVAVAAVLVVAAAVAILLIPSGTDSAPKPRRQARRTTPKPTPAPATPAPAPVQAESIDGQIAQFWTLSDSMRTAPLNDHITRPYDQLEENIRNASGSDRTRWETERVRFITQVNEEWLAEDWDRFLSKAQDEAGAGKLEEAIRILDSWPAKWRYFDAKRSVETEPEIARRDLLQELRARKAAGVDQLLATLEGLIREGKLKEAWDLYPKFRDVGEEEQVRQIGRGLVQAEFADMSVTTSEALAGATQRGQQLKSRHPTDTTILATVDEIVRGMETRLKETAGKAQERYAQILEAFDKEFTLLMKQRRYADARAQIGRILAAEDPLLVTIRYPELTAMGASLQRADAAPSELEEELRTFLPPPTAPPQTRSLLRDARAVVVLERLCHKAVEGLGSVELKGLEHSELNRSTRLTVKESAALSASVSLMPGRRTVKLVMAPNKDGTAVSDRDLIAMAGAAGADSIALQLGSMLLAHFGGDEKRASEQAYALEDELVSHFGISPTAPVAAKPGEAKPEGTEVKVDGKSGRDLTDKTRGRIRVRASEELELEAGQGGTLHFGKGQETDFAVSGGRKRSFYLSVPDEVYKALSKGDLVRLVLDPSRGPSPGAAKGIEAKRAEVEGLLEQLVRDGGRDNLDRLYERFNENARQNTSRRELEGLSRGGRMMGEFRGLQGPEEVGELTYEYKLDYRWLKPTVIIELAPDGMVNRFEMEWPDWPGGGGQGGGGPGSGRGGRGGRGR